MQINDPLQQFDEGLQVLQKDRLAEAAAAAVLHRPPVLILDEPTIGMDVVVKERIRAFLKALNSAYSTTILLTTHDMTDIEKVCARAIMINKGRKLFDGTLEALRQNSQSDSRVTVRLEKAVSPTLEEEVARYLGKGDAQ